MEKKVSLIVPIYNKGKYLRYCIDSILKQTYKNIEIILVDDGSTDDSLKICNCYKEKDKRVKVYHQKNQGQAVARNYGFNKSKGEYLCFIDADDYINEKYCEYLINMMNQNVDIAVVGVRVTSDYIGDDPVIKNTTIVNKDEAFKLMAGFKNFHGYPVNKIYRREIIQKIGNVPFDENSFYGEDYLFNCEYMKYCKKIAYNETELYNYYQSENSLARSEKVDKRRVSVFYTLSKIEKIYIKYSIKAIPYLYYFWIENYHEVYMKNIYSNYSIPTEYLEKVKEVYQKLMKAKNFSKKLKIKAMLKYKLPRVYDKLKLLKKWW